MAAFLVTYDLNRPVKGYPDVIGRLKDIGTATRVLWSAWVVETPLDAAEIVAHLAGDDRDDGYFVAELVGSWSERNLRDEADKGFLARVIGEPAR